MPRFHRRCAFVGVVLLWGCQKEAPVEAPAPAAGPALVFGLLPATTTEDVAADYGVMATELGKALGKRVEISIARDYDALANAVAAGDVHLAQLSAYLYVRVKPGLKGEALVQQRMAWDTEYRGAVVVKADGPAQKLDDLRGKSIAFVDRQSSAGYFYPRMVVRAAGHDPDAFFGAVSFAGSHLSAAQKVAAGEVDAAAVSLQTLPENLSVRVLARTDVIPDDAIVATKLSPEEIEKAKAFFLEAHNNPALNVFMNRRGIETYVSPNLGVYEALEKELGFVTQVDEPTAADPDGAAAPK